MTRTSQHVYALKIRMRSDMIWHHTLRLKAQQSHAVPIDYTIPLSFGAAPLGLMGLYTPYSHALLGMHLVSMKLTSLTC